MADDLQKIVDSTLEKTGVTLAPSQPQEEVEDVPLTAEEKKAKEDLRKEIEGEEIGSSRTKVVKGEREVRPPTPQEIAEAVRLHETKAPKHKEFSAEIVPQPKTIADLLHLEAEVANNPPTAVPPAASKIREALKNITVTQKNESSILKKIRTFKSDAAEAMTSGKSTFIGIATAQLLQNKKNESSQETLIDKTKPTPRPTISQIEASTPENKRSFTGLLIILGMLLMVGGVGAVAYVTYNNRAPISPASNNLTANALIPTQFESTIETDRKNASYLRSAVAAERKNAGGTLNDIGNIKFIKSKDSTPEEKLTTLDFIETLSMNPPEQLLRTLSPEFMLGIHRFPENRAFLIFKTDTYETARDALREWETTSLENDIGKLLRSPTDFDFIDASSTAVSIQPFTDKVLKNKDSRVLVNKAGEVIFFYTFIDRTFLVFATDPETLEVIVVGLSGRKTIN